MNRKHPELNQCLQRFFRDYLSTQRNLSPATIAAYADTFRLLFRYLRKTHPRRSSPLCLEVLTPDTILRFLDHLERHRGNCTRTRNARLATIRSFVHYLSDWLGPELPPALPRILSIPFKRHVQRMIGFLSRQEIEAILAATDQTWTGQRDHLLFLLLYNTGARISPHWFRHATAMALLEAGVPTEVIALYLGHESTKTVHLYVEASLAMKKLALAKVDPPRTKRRPFRPDEADLRFLDNL
jgi:site-specific recombinase XerD